MKHARLSFAASICLCLGNTAAAQTGAESIISDSNPRFYLLQPFYVAATKRRSLHHIGMEVIASDNAYLVSSLLDDYPAEQAGVRRGDKIISLNDKPFDPMLLAEMESSTSTNDQKVSPLPVSITLLRDNQSLTLDMQTVFENLYDSRRTAALASIQEFSAGNKTIAYYHPWALSRNFNDLLSFTRAIASIAPSDGLILDLRDSVGFLSTQHLDAFLPAGRTLARVIGPGNIHTQLETFTQPLLARHYGKPVAVLINAGTAGGTELLAYQLAALDRITTIGEPTAGEMGAYEVLDNPEGTTLNYVLATETILDGVSLPEFRVVPELPIEYPLSLTTRSDPQFQAAFNLLLGQI